MQYICPVDNEVVARTETVRGYEYAKDQYVQFSDEELKQLEGEKTNRLDIVEFVPEETVDLLYIENTYFLGPDKGGDRAYKLLSESMSRMNRVAVGRFGTRGKDHLVLVRPYKDGLIMHYVYYADEVRSMDDIDRPGKLEFRKVEEELADKLVEQLSVEAFRPEQYRDEYRDRVVAAVEQKVLGKEISQVPEQPQAQIIDLFEALKRSLGEKGEAEAVAPPEPGLAPGDDAMPLRKTEGRKVLKDKKAAS